MVIWDCEFLSCGAREQKLSGRSDPDILGTQKLFQHFQKVLFPYDKKLLKILEKWIFIMKFSFHLNRVPYIIFEISVNFCYMDAEISEIYENFSATDQIF